MKNVSILVPLKAVEMAQIVSFKITEALAFVLMDLLETLAILAMKSDAVRMMSVEFMNHVSIDNASMFAATFNVVDQLIASQTIISEDVIVSTAIMAIL